MSDTFVKPYFEKNFASQFCSSAGQMIQERETLYAARKNEAKIIKDCVEVANEASTGQLKAKKGQKIPLSPPMGTKKSMSWLGEKNTPSIIAIIGEVLALQAKTNSNFWSTLWKEASLGMKFAVNFAPLIAKAVTSSYNYQAAQSRQESDMAMWSSIISFSMFAMALGWGGIEEYSEETPSKKTPEGTNETLGTGDDPEVEELNEMDKIKSNMEKSSDTEESESESESEEIESSEEAKNKKVIELEDDENDAVEEQLEQTKRKNDQNSPGTVMQRKTLGLKDSFKEKMKPIGRILTKTAEKGFIVNTMTQAGTQANEAGHKANIAVIQEKIGTQEAASKEMEQFAQYWNQFFSRAEDLRQGSQQFIDYSMNILKSVSDSITQTVQSMFRG
ncbi:MAG: hypothetical protein KDK55_03705 [Chlamydiia bacterium]|nr:hypothetical protein [Chlamydiia bacterium]